MNFSAFSLTNGVFYGIVAYDHWKAYIADQCYFEIIIQYTADRRRSYMITRVIQDNDLLRWSLKVLIMLIWLTCVVKVPYIISEMRNIEANTPKLVRDDKVSNEAFRYTTAMVNKAMAMGKRYTPDCYFSDLVDIRTRYKGYAIPAFNLRDLDLQKTMWGAGRKNPKFDEQIINAQGKYGATLDKLEGIKRVPYNKNEEHKMLSCLIRFYFLTMLLVIPIYLIRMIERDGIAKTILSGKLEFVASVLLWIHAFGKYPHELAREVNVEAYFRRSRDLFRRLTTREKEEIERIANTDELYKAWIAQQKKIQCERGHALALLVTLIICALAPFWSMTAEANASGDKNQSVIRSAGSARDGPLQWDSGGSVQIYDHQEASCWLQEQADLSPVKVWFRIILETHLLLPLLIRQIEHVPLLVWLAARFILSIHPAGGNVRQIRGGHHVEKYVQKSYSNRSFNHLCFG